MRAPALFVGGVSVVRLVGSVEPHGSCGARVKFPIQDQRNWAENRCRAWLPMHTGLKLRATRSRQMRPGAPALRAPTFLYGAIDC